MITNDSDLKLLAYIYHNNREPLTKIARETKLTRKQVEYKINQFTKQGIIKRYLTLFNYGKLGYPNYIFLLVKFEKFSSITNFTKELKNNKNLISFGECFGKYDLFLNLVFKNEKEINNFLLNLNDNKDAIISDYLIIKPYLTEFHPLKLFSPKERKILPLAFPDETESKLDKNEIEILKLLEKDGKIKVIEIAKKLNMSAELTLHKLKKLQKENVIVGSRLFLDMKKLGYNYSGFFIHFKNMSTTTKDKIINYTRNHKLVNALVLSASKPNCFIQVFHKTDDELKTTIKEFKETFKEQSFEMEVLLINEEEKINTLPFL